MQPVGSLNLATIGWMVAVLTLKDGGGWSRTEENLREGQAEGKQIRNRASVRLRRTWRVDVSGEVLEVDEKA